MTRRQVVHATRVSIAITGIAMFLTWLVPILAGERSDQLPDRATDACRRIAAAIAQFRSDTGCAPDDPLGSGDTAWLHGEGLLPARNAIDRGSAASLESILVAGEARYGESWNGPYLHPIEADPWGRAYVVNVLAYRTSGEQAWVLSAGTNGIVETSGVDVEPRGDDLGVIIP